MNTLVLISDAFPYDSMTEISFIVPEIESLSKMFDRVIIAPRLKRGENIDIDLSTLPDNVEISDSLLIYPSIREKICAVPYVAKAIIYDLKHTSGSLRDILAYSSYVEIYRRLLKKFIRENNLDLSNTLFYTFWFDFSTASLSLIKDAKIVTRTHGHDLYEDRYFISKWWRLRSLSAVRGVFTVAEASRKYLTTLYPNYASKIFLSRLGTVNNNQPDTAKNLPDAENDGLRLSLVGISRLSPEKGVIRQFEFITQLARKHPEMQISYVHIGDGPLRSEVRQIITKAPDNLNIDLKGALHNSKVHEILSSYHFDASLLLSDSEGGCPIALCETLSYGIPAVATAVGGIPEIISGGGGILLETDADYESFEKAILSITDNPVSFRSEALRNWNDNFRSDRLRTEFAARLTELLSEA
ncbi:MAG: glycosyltransferase [Muribaculaceae bacterium]|nr:glycosyltransferase [Muribaculaceae bacterium]